MNSKRVSVVGAGISGLTLAYFLLKKGYQVEVYDEKSRPGGMIFSKVIDGFGIQENAANACIYSELLENICKDLKLEPLFPQKESKARYILWKNKFRRWPLDFIESIFFVFKFLRFLLLQKHRTPKPQETVEDWSNRHFGAALTTKLLAPALLGVYASPARKLSATLVLGRFFSIEALPSLKNFRFQNTKKVRKLSTSFKSGLGEFCEVLEKFLKTHGVLFHYNKTIAAEDLALMQSQTQVALALNIQQTAKLLETLSPDFSKAAAEVPMTNVTSATVFLKNDAHFKKGFGVIISEDHHLRTRGVLFNNCIFSNRCYQPHLWSETWILSGTFNNEEFLDTYSKERPQILGTSKEPLSFALSAWPQAFPLYGAQLETLLSKFSKLPQINQNVFVSGNFLGRIGLSQIIDQNFALAELMNQESHQSYE